MIAGRRRRATGCDKRVTTGSGYALVKGFGGASPRLFRPTYARANEWHPSIFLWVCFRVEDWGSRAVVSPISRKTSEMPRISCTRSKTSLRVPLSFKERRLEFLHFRAHLARSP